MRLVLLLLAIVSAAPAHALAAESTAPSAAASPVLFDTSFESASLGKIEKLGETEFRLHLKGQQDSRGRNRQATWFAFRMEEVAGRALTLRLASWKGEYNDRPANSPTGAWYRPVFSFDGENWQHFENAEWDVSRDQVTVTLTPRANSVWIAHVPLYPHSRVTRLLGEIDRLPHVRTEVVGETVQRRPIHLVTVTNSGRPDAGKKVVWLQARQHAWETGTSFILEGALRFVVSDDAAAKKLRDEYIFKFIPMINVDSVVMGEVRFNLRGFDPNRHWDEVNLRDKRWLERLPEVWYVKKAVLAQQAQQPIAIMVNLHNTEMNEYFETFANEDPALAPLQRFYELMVTRTAFDPSAPGKLRIFTGSGPANSTNALWTLARVPCLLMESRIGPSQKAGRILNTEDRIKLGRDLLTQMAEAVR